MLSKTKKAVILCGMLLLLVVTGYLNVVLNTAADKAVNNDDGTTLSFFESHVMEREAGRDASLLILNSIIESAESTEADKAAANAEKIALAAIIQMELNVEASIKAIGFEECVVIMGTDNINVIIGAPDNISKEQAAQIMDIVANMTGQSPMVISIYPI